MDPPGRIYQDCDFEVSEVADVLVERVGYLVVGSKPDPHADILSPGPAG